MKVKRNPREGGNQAYFRPVQVKENTEREREKKEREQAIIAIAMTHVRLTLDI